MGEPKETIDTAAEEAKKAMVPTPEGLRTAFDLKAEETAAEYERKVTKSQERLLLDVPDFKERTEDYAVIYRKALERSTTEKNEGEVAEAKAQLEAKLTEALVAAQKNEELQKALSDDERFRDLKFNEVKADRLIALVEQGMEELANDMNARKIKEARQKQETDAKAEEVPPGAEPDGHKDLPPPPKSAAAKKKAR